MLTIKEKEKRSSELAHMLYLNCSDPEMLTMVINKLNKYIENDRKTS